MFECPGAHRFRQPEPEIIKCPSCSQEVEIWTDEIKAECPSCGRVVFRQAEQSCLDWCRYAKECLGDQLYSKYMQNKTITIKQKLLKELEDYFGDDKKRIEHAKKVMGFAEELLKKEKGDWHIVIPASILHDIGIKVAEEKYGSSTGHYQEKESPGVARSILIKLGFRKEDISEICEIIAHHHTPGKVNTQNFKILYDADLLANFKGEVGLDNKERLEELVNEIFLTSSGKKIAHNVYLNRLSQK